jgi:thioesterase domain-containing protein
LSVAAVNGPSAVVVSGDNAGLDELAGFCAEQGVRARRVDVDYASHCGLVDPVAGEVAAALAGITPGAGAVPVFSTVTGDWAEGAALDGGYWWRNLREPVRFADAVTSLAGAGFGVFIEASPHPVLTAAIQQTAEAAGADPVVAGTLRRGEGGAARLVASLAQVWARGGAADWAAVLGGGHAVRLPTYAFQRQRYWPGRPVTARDAAGLGLSAAGHPLLGAVVELPDEGGVALTGRLSPAAQPWLLDHQVGGTVIVPGAALIEMVIRAGDEVGCDLLEELILAAPLVVPEHGALQVLLSVAEPDEQDRRAVTIHARPESPAEAGTGSPWIRHATGVLAPGAAPASFDLASWPPPGAEPIALDPDAFYTDLAGQGLEYGPSFQALTAAWRLGEEVFAEVALPQAQPAEGFGLHPALLDAAWHAARLGSSGPGAAMERARPFAWTDVVLHAAGAAALRVRIAPAGPDAVTLQAADAAGAPVVSVASLTFRAQPVPEAAHGAAFPAAGPGRVRPRPRRRQTTARRESTATWARRLAAMTAAAREEAVLDLVRDEVAAVLGHGSGAQVQAGQAFLELGFDSVTALELRSRISQVTGLRLPAAVVFDHPTAAALARRICAELDAEPAAAGPAGAGPAGAAPSLGGLYERALSEERTGEFMDLLRGLARFRPTFTSGSGLERAPDPVVLARGGAAPGLVCLPSFVGKSGAYLYARFADAFRGVRPVRVLSTPGFAAGEPLAATADALIGLHADRITGGEARSPLVLVGHSSGGLLAHALAARLENLGSGPAAVVLMDTYSPGNMRTLNEAERGFTRGLAAQNLPTRGDDDDAWLTAMAHYLSLDWWDLSAIEAPTLLVRAQEPMAGAAENESWKLSWEFAAEVTVVDVPGNHFTMMAQHAATTARAVTEWLGQTVKTMEG